jgi:amino acid transporter
VTTLLTDFSGYLIFVVAIALTLALIVFALIAGQHLDFSRLFTFTNYTGDAGGGVWPQSNSILYAFVVGLLLVTYTVTGYDASAHTSEETHNAEVNVPRGMWQSVFYSVVFGYLMVAAFVLVMPSVADGAKQGANVFGWLMAASPMPAIVRDLLYIGIVVANYLCGLAGLTSTSRMMYAFSRDGGLPFSTQLGQVSPRYRTPTIAIWVSAVLAFISVLYGQAFSVLVAGCAVFLYISYVMPVLAGLLAEGKAWKQKGPFNLGAYSKVNAVLAILGGLVLVWVGFQPPNQLVGYLIIGLIVFMAVLWLARERTRFAGPPQGDQIAARQGAIAEIEAKLEKGAAD